MTLRRSRSKRGEGDLLRAEILDAAEAVLLETGSTEKVSTRAVAQRVGCSSPSIYLHFPDRAQMLFAVCERRFEQLAALMRAAADEQPDPIERLKAIGRVYCDFALANPQQYRTMMMDVIAGAAYEKSLDEMRAELGFDVLFETVSEGIETGVFADVDPLQTSFNFWCVGHGIVSLMIAKTGIEWGDEAVLVEGALDQAIGGILPRAPVTRKQAATKTATRPAAKTTAAKKSAAKKSGATRAARPRKADR